MWWVEGNKFNDEVCCFYLNREKAKLKEREEAWIKIENLAKSNPQVSECEYLLLFTCSFSASFGQTNIQCMY